MPFLILGGLVGVAVAAVIAYALPGDASYDRGSVFGFFMVLCAAGGVILGAATALVLDRMSVRRAEHAVVESAPDAGRRLGRRREPRLSGPAGHKPAAGKVLAHIVR